MIEEFDELFEDVADAEPQLARWTLPDVLPAGLVFLAGPPKSYKSTLVNAAVLAVTNTELAEPRASRFLGQLAPSRSATLPEVPLCVLWSFESSAGELRAGFERNFGAKLGAAQSIVAAKQPWAWQLDTQARDFLGVLRELQPALAVVDPFVAFHAVDENDAGALARTLGPFREWAVDSDSTFLIVHHTRKLDQKKGADHYTPNDIRGSGALFGLADGIIMVTPETGAEFPEVFVHCTFKRSPPRQFRLTLDLPGYELGEAP